MEFGYLLVLLFSLPLIGGIAWGSLDTPSPNWRKHLLVAIPTAALIRGGAPFLTRQMHLAPVATLLWLSPVVLIGFGFSARALIHGIRLRRAEKKAAGPDEEDLRAQKPRADLAEEVLGYDGLPKRRPFR